MKVDGNPNVRKCDSWVRTSLPPENGTAKREPEILGTSFEPNCNNDYSSSSNTTCSVFFFPKERAIWTLSVVSCLPMLMPLGLKNNILESKLLLVFINFTPEAIHSWVKSWYTMFPGCFFVDHVFFPMVRFTSSHEV